MSFKYGFLLIALLSGCLAKPSLEAGDLSMFFKPVDTSATRILGGSPAPPRSAPHMVALTTGSLMKSFTCGGSLVTVRTIVTAAHCVEGVSFLGSLPSSYRATVGTNVWYEGGASYAIERNVTHPHFSIFPLTSKNDIALLITSTEVRLSDHVQIIPMSFGYVRAGVEVRATGWGMSTLELDGPILQLNSNILMELTMTTIGGQECVDAVLQASEDLDYPSFDVDPATELCTFHSVNSGMCHGDSGSALVRTDVGGQVGVVSWGIPCARGAPDVFTRVSAFREFIETNAV